MLDLIARVLLAGALMTSSDAERGRNQAVRTAKETLSRELDVEVEKISVQQVTPAEWPDTSLGCPRKGTRYSPVVTSGYRVVLEQSGKRHVVHVGDGHAVLCDTPPSGPRIPEERLAEAARLSEWAREDLAKRLKLAKTEVKVGFVRPTTWPDASLGCPRPGEVYAQVLTEGFLIELEAGGKTYAYHADRSRAALCETGK